MTTTWVQVCSTSASRWLDTRTVRPVGGVAGQHVAHLADLRRVQPVRRLVQHEQRAGRASPGRWPAAAACRGCSRAPGDARRRPGRRSPGPPRGARPAGRPVAPQYSRRFSRPDTWGRKPGPSTNDPTRDSTGAPGTTACPKTLDPPLGRQDQAHQHAQHGGLAGAVGPEQAEHPAGLHPERQVADRSERRRCTPFPAPRLRAARRPAQGRRRRVRRRRARKAPRRPRRPRPAASAHGTSAPQPVAGPTGPVIGTTGTATVRSPASAIRYCAGRSGRA